MESLILKSIKEAVKHWYIPVLVGLFFVIVSIVSFTSPESSLLTLSILFALSFLFSGLSEIFFAVINRDRLDNWGWSLAFGIITFLVGFSLVIHPALSLSVLAFYIGFVILFRSIAAISFAIDIKNYGNKNWLGLLLLGVIGTIFSFILIWNPLFAGLSMVYLIALSFLFAGLFSIFLGLQLRQLHKNSRNMSSDLRERYEEVMKAIQEEYKN